MQDNHLFLFEYIPKGSNVLIYGFGTVDSQDAGSTQVRFYGRGYGV